jgi:FkbM family methyltransferase
MKILNIFRKTDQVLKKISNDLFELRRGDLVVRSMHRNTLKGTFEKIFINEIYAFDSTKQSPVIIDGGANIGLATLYWKVKYPQARITAFEPSKQVVSMLIKNLDLNSIRDVQVIEAALYDQDGYFEFTSNEALSGSLILAKDLSFNYKVKTARLSQYINEEIDLLKLDIEGAELNVLDEIKSKLKFVKRIFIEYHSFVDRPQQLDYLLSILREAEFRYYLDAEYHVSSPFKGFKISLGQDLQVNIWATKMC